MAIVPGFEHWAGRLEGRSRQSLVLTRHFFNRLFQNDVFPFEEQMKEKVYVLLAMLASVGWLLTTTLFSPYMFAQDIGQSWREKLAYLTFFMVFLALAVVLEWDVLYPDRRDHLNLGPLPVRPGTVVNAKLASFAFFTALYTAAVSSLSLFGISFFLPRWTGDSLASLAAYAVAHVAAGAAAYAFVFLALLFLEGVLMTVLGPRLFRGVSLAIRFALALVVVVALVLSLTDVRALQAFIDLAAEARESHPLSLLAWPPFWFVSIYEILIGRGEPLYTVAASIGAAAIVGLALAGRAAIGLSYRRQLRKAGEVRARAKLFPRARAAAGRAVDRVLFRRQSERSVYHFIGETLSRSPVHKVRMAGSAAFALAGVFLIVGLPRTGWASPGTAGFNVLGAPLAMGLFLLIGLRSVFNVPYAADANWAFRMTERPGLDVYTRAVKKFVALWVLAPLAVSVVLVHVRQWGMGPSVRHALYVLTWTTLFAQVIFWRYARIPFACSVVPGKARMYSRWLPYVVGFLVAFGLLATLETALLRGGAGGFGVFLAFMAVLLAGLHIVQRRFVYPKLALVYEEQPEPVMITL